MRLWKLNLRLIRLKKMNFLLATVILLIGLIATNYMTSFIESNLLTLKIISALDEQKYVYFKHLDPALRASITEDDVNTETDTTYDELVSQTLSQLTVTPAVCNVSINYGLISLNNGNQDLFYIKQLSSNLNNILHIPLAQGRWCEKAEDDLIEAVVSNQNQNYHVGDIVEMDCVDQTYRVMITGILDHSQLEFSLSIGGDELCSLDFLSQYDESDRECTLAYFPPSVYLSDSEIERGRILLFPNDISDEMFEEEVSFLCDYGYVHTKEDLRNGTMEQVRVALSRYLPTILLLVMIVILGLTSSAFLTLLEYRKHFAVFFIVGCTWAQCTIINIMYVFTSVATSVLGFLIYQFVLSKVHFSMYNFALTAALCVFVILISALIPYQNMKRMTPKELIMLEND